MRGRKPKPTYLKIIEGNPGKRPLNDAEPQPTEDIGGPPDWMTEREQAIWREALRCAPNGMVKRLDIGVFAAWVGAYAIWEDAKQRVSRFGTMVRSPVQNVPIQNPYLAVVNKQALLMAKLSAELGFTPSARSRVKIDKAKKQTAFSDLKSINDID
jgi:P27 family predicted phage terminase small subunit